MKCVPSLGILISWKKKECNEIFTKNAWIMPVLTEAPQVGINVWKAAKIKTRKIFKIFSFEA